MTKPKDDDRLRNCGTGLKGDSRRSDDIPQDCSTRQIASLSSSVLKAAFIVGEVTGGAAMLCRGKTSGTGLGRSDIMAARKVEASACRSVEKLQTCVAGDE